MKTLLECLLAVSVFCILIAFAAGCVTDPGTGKKTLDQCKVMAVAQGTHEAGNGISLAVCAFLKDPVKRAKCIDARGKASYWGGVVVNMGAGILKACGL